MKKFLMHIGIVTAITFVIFLFLDRVITHNLHRSDAMMFYRWNHIIFDTTQYDILINGNSRAWTFYDPYIIDSICCANSYNIGLDGRWLPSQIARYNLYRKYHKPPKILVQSVDQSTLASNNSKYEREQFLPYLSINSLYSEVHRDEGYTLIDKYVPFVRYIGYRDVIFEGLGLHNDLYRCNENYYKGYEPNGGKWRTNTGWTIDSIHFDCNPAIVHKFEQYVADLRSDNVNVVFVFGPSFRGFKDSIIVGAEEQRMYDWFYYCAEKYGCEVLNYMQFEFCCDTVLFFDPIHVNTKGSKWISTKLAYDLDSMNLLH